MRIQHLSMLQLRRHVSTLLLAVAAASLMGCSTFNRDWKAAAAHSAPSDGLAGRWQGTWLSDVNGHTDALRCLMTKVGETNYFARFEAKYKRGIRFTVRYTIPLVTEKRTNDVAFSGEANLGWLRGGVYRYEGHADATTFFSTYECKYDHGTFRMTRPGAGE